MKFDVKDRVTIKSTLESGIITQCKYEKTIINGTISEKTTYRIEKENKNRYYQDWQPEENLQFQEEYDREMEIGFLDLLIDSSLLNQEHEQAKSLYQEKIELIKKGANK